MSPTLRRAHCLQGFRELGWTAHGLFRHPVRRRHLTLVCVPPAPGPGQLPNRFADLGRPRPFDQEGSA